MRALLCMKPVDKPLPKESKLIFATEKSIYQRVPRSPFNMLNDLFKGVINGKPECCQPEKLFRDRQ